LVGHLAKEVVGYGRPLAMEVTGYGPLAKEVAGDGPLAKEVTGYVPLAKEVAGDGVGPPDGAGGGGSIVGRGTDCTALSQREEEAKKSLQPFAFIRTVNGCGLNRETKAEADQCHSIHRFHHHLDCSYFESGLKVRILSRSV